MNTVPEKRKGFALKRRINSDLVDSSFIWLGFLSLDGIINSHFL
jgi:hypothetical protein